MIKFYLDAPEGALIRAVSATGKIFDYITPFEGSYIIYAQKLNDTGGAIVKRHSECSAEESPKMLFGKYAGEPLGIFVQRLGPGGEVESALNFLSTADVCKQFSAWINWYSEKEFYIHATEEAAIKHGDWKDMRPKARFPIYGEFQISNESSAQMEKKIESAQERKQAVPKETSGDCGTV